MLILAQSNFAGRVLPVTLIGLFKGCLDVTSKHVDSDVSEQMIVIRLVIIEFIVYR